MNPKEIPFNITLLDTKSTRLPASRQIKTREPFEGSTQNYHPEGLFSTEIFGRVGSDDRDRLFGFIALNTTVMHPFIFKTISRLKGLYRGIMEGHSYVIWDEKAKDFVQSDEIHGETGMHLFLKHWKDINYNRSESDVQKERAKAVKRFMSIAMTDVIWVMPAGYRDVQINEDGRVEENEINDFYRRIVGIADSMPSRSFSPIVDTSRYRLQKEFNDLYAYIEATLTGKKKHLRGKWARRAITNGTRNVLTSMDTSSPRLGHPAAIGINSTVVGLYQAAKAILPVTKFHLRTGWVNEVFYPEQKAAMLVDPTTLKRERIELDAEMIDRWTSNDGLEKIITSLHVPELRSRPVKIHDYYLGLIYQGPDMTYKIFGDIDELPDGFSRENVSPLTYAEWLYLSMADKWHNYPIFPCRYPVAGEGSSFPSKIFLQTTAVSEVRYMLDENWQVTDTVAKSFPKKGEKSFFDTMAPHPSRLEGMAGDFDGDMGSGNAAYENRSMQQVDDYFNTRAAYVAPSGDLRASPFDYIFELVARNMTGVIQ